MRSARPLPLVLLALASAGGVAATYELLVRTSHGQRLDQGAFDGRALATATAHDAAQHLLTTISVGTLVIAVAVLVVQALLRRRIGLALAAGTVLGGSIVTTQVLKDVLLRPDLVVDGRLWENSFPSGHATIAFAIGVAATLVAPATVRKPVAFLAVLYGAAVGIAVVAAGWHRPSDVAGAFFVVTGWAAVIALVGARSVRRRGDTSSWRRASPARGSVLVGALLVGAGYLATLAFAAAGRAGAVDWTSVDGAFAAACVTIVGLAALLMAALLGALHASLPQSAAVRGRAPAR
ncbi:MAG TPA: phosphatase PAP2 family protein [Conexibacter sp.]